MRSLAPIGFLVLLLACGLQTGCTSRFAAAAIVGGIIGAAAISAADDDHHHHDRDCHCGRHHRREVHVHHHHYDAVEYEVIYVKD